jgi:hypothetical protein
MEALPVTPKLPQPLRQVDKVLTSLVEKAVQLSESKKGGKSQAGVSYEETGLVRTSGLLLRSCVHCGKMS